MILVTAEEFGYGPSVTLNCIIENVRKCLPEENILFLGNGIALEQAKRSKLYSQYIVCNTFDFDDLNRCQQYFEKADFIICSENLNGAIYSVRKGLKTFYIDNLFWMWASIPNELKLVEKYFITDFVGVDDNIKRLAYSENNLVKVGPLRILEDKNTSLSKKDIVLINIGGADSFLSERTIVVEFYSIVINLIVSAAKKYGYENIRVCGGSSVLNELQNKNKNSQIEFISYSHDDYKKTLAESKYVFLSPGLGNFFETLCIDQNVFMLPPINYSQFLQLEEFKKLDIGIITINWNNFEWYFPVKKFQEEKEGVNAVLKNIKCFIETKDSREILYDEIASYFKCNYWNNLEQRTLYKKRYSNNGIQAIADEIILEVRNNVSL